MYELTPYETTPSGSICTALQDVDEIALTAARHDGEQLLPSDRPDTSDAGGGALHVCVVNVYDSLVLSQDMSE